MSPKSISRDKGFRSPSWWKRRTVVEKRVIISIIIIFITIIVLTCGVILFVQRSAENTKLYSKSNVESAAIMLNYINKDVDPCDDFYDFACGNFLKETVIPLDKTDKNAFQDRDEAIFYQLLDLFEEPEKPEDPRSFNLVKSYYRACLNESVIEQRGVQPIKDLLYNLGSFPILDKENWNEDNFEWINMMKKIRQLGFDVDCLINFDLTIDYKNASKHTLQLGKTQWDADIPGYYLKLNIDHEKLQNYYNFMLDMFEFLDLKKEYIKEEVREVLEFMRNLTLISSDDLEITADIYNPTTIADLQNKYPSINWIEYINNILDTSTKFTSKDIVNVKVPSFIQKFETLMKSTSKRTIANYLGWRAYRTLISAAPTNLKHRQSQQIQSIKGTEDAPVRWKSCVNRANYYIDIAASALYVRNYFDKEIKDQVMTMIEYIKTAYIDLLKRNKWMTIDTRNYAIEKIEAIRFVVAYPDELINDTIINDFYSSLEINENLYMELRLNVTKFLNNIKYNKLFQPADKYDWVGSSDVADANNNYKNRKNSIAVNAGLLDGLFFGKNKPKYMNYGAIGTLIGLLFTAAITSNGRTYDKNGVLNNWWTREADEIYLGKSQCFIEQYNNYTIPMLNKKVNGKATQNININDFGGVQTAYNAYIQWLKHNQEENPLPGLSYTSRQLFWINRAQIWCSQDRNEQLEYTNAIGYTPKRFRVNGPLVNSPEFSKDFNCPKDSNMNPKNKCTLF